MLPTPNSVCVQYFCVSKQWYGCQCLRLFTHLQMLMHAITHQGLYRHNKRVFTESWLWEKNPPPDPSLIHHSHVFLGSQWKDDKAPAADECSLSGPWAAAGARGWRLPDRHQEPSTASQRCRTTAVQGLCCAKFISLCLQPFLCFAGCKSHGCEGVLGDGWCTWSRKESFSSLSFVVINVFVMHEKITCPNGFYQHEV